jgi:C1A family cysteine protease
MTAKFYTLGCKKDPEDLRDIPMGLVLPAIPVPLSIDYTSKMTPVRNQGDEGTCVAFASVVGVKEFEDQKEYRKLIELSPRYVYSLCKKFDGFPEEEGTYPRIAMKMLLKYGVCPEFFWPYRPFQNNDHKPGADQKAKNYRIKAYARLKDIAEMKRSLMVNGPFLAGVKVFDSWFDPSVARTGMVPMPKKGEDLTGGHAICIVGYDDRKKLFKFKNSWSKKWADRGYGYLKYEYLSRYCQDAWSATDLIVNPKALVKKIEELLKRFT